MRCRCRRGGIGGCYTSCLFQSGVVFPESQNPVFGDMKQQKMQQNLECFILFLSVKGGSFRFPHILSWIFQRLSSPPFFPAPAVRKYGKSLFFSKKRQSHPKVTLSQKHVVSLNWKEDNPLSLIKKLRNYTSTVPYFLIMSTPFAGQIFRPSSKCFSDAFLWGKK